MLAITGALLAAQGVLTQSAPPEYPRLDGSWNHLQTPWKGSFMSLETRSGVEHNPRDFPTSDRDGRKLQGHSNTFVASSTHNVGSASASASATATLRGGDAFTSSSSSRISAAARARPHSYGGSRVGQARRAQESSPDGAPNPRLVSNTVCKQEGAPEGNLKTASLLLIMFGQFLDHDITLIGLNDSEEETSNMATDAADEPFKGRAMHFVRSKHNTSESNGELREYSNLNTHFLDLSSIYGETQEKADALRANDGSGKLATSSFYGKEHLPLNQDIKIEIAGDTRTLSGDIFSNWCDLRCFFDDFFKANSQFFAGGDVRVNEQPMLIVMTLLFVREHNRLATEFKKSNPSWTDQELYDAARLVNIMQYQRIIYEEYLPALLGRKTLQDLLPEFNPNTDFESIDPSTDLFFSTAAYRYGHSGVADHLPQALASGTITGQIALKDVFFVPDIVVRTASAVDRLLNGARVTQHETIDLKVVDALRNFLFANMASDNHIDLAATNIQRGRDHALADINTYRALFGLPPHTTFADITSDPQIAQDLESLYGSVDKVDVFIGGLAEDKLEDSALGELFTLAVADQFRRYRDGDRFFYLRPGVRDRFDVPLLTLAEVIERNTDEPLKHSPPAFYVRNFFPTYVGQDRVIVEWTGRGFSNEKLPDSVNGVQLELNGSPVDAQLSFPAGNYEISDLTPGEEVKVTLSTLGGSSEIIGSVTVTPGSGSDASAGSSGEASESQTGQPTGDAQGENESLDGVSPDEPVVPTSSPFEDPVFDFFNFRS